MSNNTPTNKTNNAKHTPEPWAYDWHFIVAPDPKGIHPDIYIAEIVQEDSEGRCVSPEEQQANIQRIVACVNACAGISTKSLEQGVISEFLKSMAQARPIGNY
jgi:hypothetical protein